MCSRRHTRIRFLSRSMASLFVRANGAPSGASIALTVCWASKSPAIRKDELTAAKDAYDHARNVYRQILADSYDDVDAAKQKAAN